MQFHQQEPPRPLSWMVHLGLVVGGGFGGFVGASLVWDFIYGLATVDDDTYDLLHDDVPGWGAVAGAVVALAIVMSLRRPAPVVLASCHAAAIVAGLIGGSIGWRVGLWAYFGTLVAFVICAAFRRARRVGANGPAACPAAVARKAESERT